MTTPENPSGELPAGVAGRWTAEGRRPVRIPPIGRCHREDGSVPVRLRPTEWIRGTDHTWRIDAGRRWDVTAADASGGGGIGDADGGVIGASGGGDVSCMDGEAVGDGGGRDLLDVVDDTAGR